MEGREGGGGGGGVASFPVSTPSFFSHLQHAGKKLGVETGNETRAGRQRCVLVCKHPAGNRCVCMSWWPFLKAC